MNSPLSLAPYIALFGLAPGTAALAAVANSPQETAVIHVRVLNGHTGKPIANSGVYPHLDPRRPLGLAREPVTDSNGTAPINVPLHTRLNVIVNQYPTCRHVAKADRAQGPIAFPVDQILATGIVETNSCSHRTVTPTPGELTLFVRPLHWWERLSD